MMMFRKLCVALVHACTIASMILVAMPTAVEADVQTEMNSYYKDMSAASYNLTGPTAYVSQSGGYLSGGSLYARFPQKTIQPFNLQLPHASAGCGGIDVFSGSISFVNSDQIIAMMKSVINSAKGYIFELAIHALSGVIGNVLDVNVKKVLDEIGKSRSSCQLAEGAVNAAMDAVDLGGTLGCTRFAEDQGYDSDWSAAMEDCTNSTTNANLAKQQAQSTNPNGQAMAASNPTLPHNVTWQMLANNPEFSGRDQQFREMIMTLVGTIVYNTDAGSISHIQHYGGDPKTIFRSILDGTGTTSTTIMACDEATACLNPKTQTLNINSANSLKGIVNAAIIEMQNDIKTSQPLSTQLQTLLQSTHIPLYRILVVYSAAQSGLQAGDIDNLSELVAYDLVDRMLTKILGDVAISQNFTSQADQTQLTQWRQQYEDVMMQMRDERDGMKGRMDAVQGWIQRTSLLETTLQNTLSTQMQASIGFARNLRKPGL